MKQEKRALYDLYQPIGSFIVQRIRKSLPAKERKHVTRKEAFQQILQANPMLINSLDFLIASEDLYWEKQGKQVIFPENSAVLDNLLKAKYQMESSEGFSLPFSSFIVAIPNGYSFEGVQLPSFMVTHIEYKQSQNITIFPFCDYVECKKPEKVEYEKAADGERSIVVSFRDPESDGYIRMMQLESALPDILRSKTLEEFRHAIGDYTNKVGVVQSNSNDLAMQFLSMKLVAALGVYNLATGGERLREGFPGRTVPRIIGSSEPIKIRYTTLTGTPVSGGKASPDTHYRSWHFRQLRDDRFYKGEHASLPRGSRYVFVSDTIVGNKVTPYTQETK